MNWMHPDNSRDEITEFDERQDARDREWQDFNKPLFEPNAECRCYRCEEAREK